MNRLLIGLALLPTSFATLLAAAKTFPSLFHSSHGGYFLAGFAAYPLLYLWARPGRVYVFGHELSHVLAAVLSGSRVTKFQVGTESGRVELTSVNPFISLAPYCLPLYSLAWIVAFRLGGLWWDISRLQSLFLAGMGLTLSFHLFTTGSTLLGRKQPDLVKAGGVVFSLSLIALANGLAVALTLRGLFPGLVSLREFLGQAWSGTTAFWACAWAGLDWLLETFRAAASAPSPGGRP